jgi:hypothetical protein
VDGSTHYAPRLRRAYDVCEVFITPDRNLEFQQNIQILSFGIVVVRALQSHCRSCAPEILHTVTKVAAGRIATVMAQPEG